MKTYELILHPPKSYITCIWKAAEANSIEEFADMCDKDIFLSQLFSVGWTIARVREVKTE